MSDADPHIRRGEDGVLRVGKAGVPLDVIGGIYHATGEAAHVLHHHPHLTREEIAAAIRYLKQNPDDIDSQATHPDAAWRQRRIMED
ncbi:MAG: hypothetical protein JWN51_521 [Phycisphaerales bacterium]|jgi:uncharacterized protein (DUF433 family)|nr:hypothetical protein [Phycisphaerales bacterium]